MGSILIANTDIFPEFLIRFFRPVLSAGFAEGAYASLEDSAKSWQKVIDAHEGMELRADLLGEGTFMFGAYHISDGAAFANGRYHTQAFGDESAAKGWKLIELKWK